MATRRKNESLSFTPPTPAPAAKKGARPAKKGGGRGSPEAIEKRRMARALNSLLSGKASAGSKALDGRTAKRRERLLEELKSGNSKATKSQLKPIDVLSHVNELLGMGESVGAIRKIAKKFKLPVSDAGATAQTLAGVQKAYSFRPEAFSFLGLPREVLEKAGVVDAGKRGPGRPRKKG